MLGAAGIAPATFSVWERRSAAELHARDCPPRTRTSISWFRATRLAVGRTGKGLPGRDSHPDLPLQRRRSFCWTTRHRNRGRRICTHTTEVGAPPAFCYLRPLCGHSQPRIRTSIARVTTGSPTVERAGKDIRERRVWDLHPCLRLEGPLSWLLDERALWRRPDSHRQPPGYEPGELLLLHSATLPTGVAPVAFRSTGGRSAIRDLRELMLGPDGVAPSPSGFRPVALLIELRTREQASCQEAFVASLYGRHRGRCHRRLDFLPRCRSPRCSLSSRRSSSRRLHT